MVDLVSEIKEKVSMMDLLTRLNIEVNRAGFVFSPYRTERTASCKIYPATNSFCDMADMRGGSVIDFYMAFYNVDAGPAIKELAALFNISGAALPDRKPASNTVTVNQGADPRTIFNNEEKFIYEKRVKDVGEQAALREIRLIRLEKNREIFLEFYCYCNTKGWDPEALHYLKDIRKIPEYYIELFNLFSIRNYNEVSNHLKKQFSLKDLQRSGLFNIKEDGGGNLIFYNHRIIIPHKWKHSIVYLRGRYFTDGSAKCTPGTKYLGLKNDAFNLNSPKRFFNIDILNDMIPGERLYMVEGEFDTIAGASMKRNFIGVPGAGCLPSKKEFQKLLPFDIVFCGEQDNAGKKMLNGEYIDKSGNDKYSENNIINHLRQLGKEIGIRILPSKDLNDFIAQDAA